MTKRFSDLDLQELRMKLEQACEESWRIRGYKQTNIPLLTKTVGISSGAFYLIYKRKEDLFLQVLKNVQKNLLDTWSNHIKEAENKLEGFKSGLKWLFIEYQTYPNLYDMNSPEYDLFLAKLPEREVTLLKENSIDIFRVVIKESQLKLKLPEEEVINIIHSILFLSLVERGSLTGTKQTFEFLLTHTLHHLFKEE